LLIQESSSGTYEFFKDEVMDKKNYATDILNLPATGATVQAVGQTKGAIDIDWHMKPKK
jgi:phosphate transport system substrate-binding protein